jgi:hypothetical protein
MKEFEYLRKVYKQNPKTGNFVIEVLLETYLYAFNEWDSAYFQRRDLDPDLIKFLESCSNDIPLQYGVELSFSVFSERKEETEKAISDGIKSYFYYSIHSEEVALKDLFAKMAMYVGVSITFLVLAFFAGNIPAENVLTITLNEGLYIGGWVFLWEAISLLSFNRSKIYRKIKEYKRFLKAPVYFEYTNKCNVISVVPE